MPVHDVDVNPVGAGRDDLGHLVGQMAHVGRQDRRGELDVVERIYQELMQDEYEGSLANPAGRIPSAHSH